MAANVGPSVSLTGGVLRVSDRTANIHPTAYDPKVTRYAPLDTYPLTLLLDKLPKGRTFESRTFNWFEKPFNSLTGTINDVYTTNSFGTAVSTAKNAGDTVYVNPDTAGYAKLRNMREYDNVEIYTDNGKKSVRGYVTAVHLGSVGSSYFSFVLDTNDTNSVLADTSLYWTITGRGEEEVHELGDAITEHETQYTNYMQMMEEAHIISEAELYELSRIEEDLKKDKELDSLQRLNQRRELAFLEGTKRLIGDRYYTGGLRWWLNQYESGNLIDWTTDTTYSASTDTVTNGLLPFLKRFLLPLRQWSKPGARKILVCSQTVRGILDECVLNAGMYQIDYNTNKYGINVSTLRGLDQELDIVEEPLFNNNPAKKYTVYIIEPELIARATTPYGALKRIPWSGLDDAGDNYKTYIKGGWRVVEGYQFRRPGAHAIIENFGRDKS
jgi:hypothetical protein